MADLRTDTSDVRTEAFYLTSGSEPVYALLDAPPAGAPRRGAVLICPLFGNEDLCAYRARREWARALAAEGRPALRIDLPSTGDSPGEPGDPGRLEAWIDALGTAARWLAAEAPEGRLTAIGIGLGGLLACRATERSAPIEDLVLWSVPARGRTFVRQLRALARLQEASVEDGAPPGGLAAGGFALSAQTLAELEALDLSGIELPDAQGRRVLLLQRDGLDVDARLRAALEAGGSEVTLADGPDYGAMVAPPQESRPPLQTFATVARWLAQGDPAAPSGPARETQAASAGAASARSLELTVAGARIRETPLAIPHRDGRLLGVLAEPEQAVGMCAVLLNAGALRHIGPGRMWVEAARRWAGRGVPTLRIDLSGIGDSDGDFHALREDEGFYVSSFVEETLELLDALVQHGLPGRFVLGGLCSGAYWSLHAALRDDRVAAAYMVNPRALFWDWRLRDRRNVRNLRKVASATTWRRVLRGQSKPPAAGELVRSLAITARTLPTRWWSARRAREDADELELALERLERKRVEALAVFTAHEPLLEELERDGGLARMTARPNVRVVRVPGPLRSHTLEPLPLQRAVHRALDEALDRQLRTLADRGSDELRRATAR